MRFAQKRIVGKDISRPDWVVLDVAGPHRRLEPGVEILGKIGAPLHPPIGRRFAIGRALHFAEGPFLQAFHLLGDREVGFPVILVEGSRIGGLTVENEEADHGSRT